MTLDQQIRAILNGYDHDAAGQIDHLTGSIRAVLDYADQQLPSTRNGIRLTIATALGITPDGQSPQTHPEKPGESHSGGTTQAPSGYAPDAEARIDDLPDTTSQLHGFVQRAWGFQRYADEHGFGRPQGQP